MRTKISVEKFAVSPFVLKDDSKRPFEFLGYATISIWLKRTYTDGRVERAKLVITICPGYMTDGASTFWPISKLVPQWIKGDDRYNAAPTAHDVLYLLGGIVLGSHELIKLSREEVDDILRGIWRCWGMSRFVAGAADKCIEWFAGSDKHWGNDSYNVIKYVKAEWQEIENEDD